jgi:hypothetical protein
MSNNELTAIYQAVAGLEYGEVVLKIVAGKLIMIEKKEQIKLQDVKK